MAAIEHMFCKSIRAMLAGWGLATRIRELLGIGVGAFVAAGGCATHVTFRDHHHAAGAAGMAGFMNSGGAGSGRGGGDGGSATGGSNAGKGGKDGTDNSPAGAASDEGGTAGDDAGGAAGRAADSGGVGGTTATGGRGGREASGGGVGEVSGGSDSAGRAQAGSGSGGAPSCGPCAGGYVCSGGMCKTSCATDKDCRSDYFCSGNVCKVDAVQVGISSTHACIALADGTVRCWGQNGDRELGTTSPSDASTPQQVQGITTAKAVAASRTQSIALLDDGTVVFWGTRASEYIPSTSSAPPMTTYTTAASPTAISEIGTAKDIQASTETDRACVLMNDDTVRCWGFDTRSDGSTSFWPIPKSVDGVSNVSAIAMGNRFTCVVLSGNVGCWGWGTEHELGSAENFASDPVAVTGLSGSVSKIHSGDYFTCVLITSGAVECWGSNNYHQLGATAGDVFSSATPAITNGLSSVKDLSAGEANVCVVEATGGVTCWGDDTYAQLGDQQQNNGSGTPVSVQGLAGPASSVTSGFFNACAVLESGSVQCWGRSIGDLSATPTATPATVW